MPKDNEKRETVEPVAKDTHPDLFETIQTGLADILTDEPDAVIDAAIEAADAQPADDVDDVDESTERKTVEDTSEDETDDGQQETDEDDAEAAADDAPSLPESWRRALTWAGWTEAEIDEGLSKAPDTLRDTAERLHMKRAEQAAEWGRKGREHIEQSRSGGENRGDETVSSLKQPKSANVDGIPLIDVAALKDEHGDDPLIDKIVGPVNDILDRINKVLPAINDATDGFSRLESDRIGQMVDDFFGQKHVEPYRQFYGESFQTASDEQLDNREQVLTLADAIMAGAELQGRELTTSEALEFAHLSIAAEFKTAAVRDELVKSVRKRGQSVSVRPSRSKNAGKQADSRTSLEHKVADGLSSVFTPD
jgi:hypothetical protein